MSSDILDRPRYEQDVYAWALDQAARLRALADERGNAPIDWELVAEEVEEVGTSRRDACESFVELIIAHLLKIECARDPPPIRHWRAEIEAFRIGLSRKRTPSIDSHLRASLTERFRLACRLARSAMDPADPEFAARLPQTCPYTWEQITGDWLPGRGVW